MKHTISALAMSFATLTLVSCEQAADQAQSDAPGQEAVATVSNARLVLPTVAGNPAGVFFDLTNTGSEPLTLESVAIEGAGGAMIHDVTMDDGVASMSMIESAEIGAGETLAFAPRGKHLMAMQLDEGIAAGDEVDVTLSFAGDRAVTFSAEVQSFGQEQ